MRVILSSRGQFRGGDKVRHFQLFSCLTNDKIAIKRQTEPRLSIFSRLVTWQVELDLIFCLSGLSIITIKIRSAGYYLLFTDSVNQSYILIRARSIMVQSEEKLLLLEFRVLSPGNRRSQTMEI